MKLRSLLIEQLHNTRKIALPQVGPGVHIVLGANGSGKSSSVLAIQGLLWPSSLEHIPFPQVQSEWSYEGKSLRIERKGEATQWALDSNKVAAPPLPPAHLANCYTLTLDDLFDGDGQELAEEIERDFAGGYDFKLLRAKELHGVSKGFVSKTRKELQEKRKTLRETALRQETLSQKEELLQQQYAEIERIKQNQRRERFLEKARERLRCLQSASEIEQQLAAFPDPLVYYKGFEAAHYKELSGKAATARKDLQLAKNRLAEAESIAQHSAFDPASDKVFDEALCKSQLESIRESHLELGNLELSRKDEQARLEDLSAKIPGIENLELSANLGAAELEEIAQAFRLCEEHFQRYQAKREELATLTVEHSAAELDELLTVLHRKGERLSLLLREHAALQQSSIATYLLCLLSLPSIALLSYFSDLLPENQEFQVAVAGFITLATLFTAGALIARLRSRARQARIAAGLLEDADVESLESLRTQMSRDIAKLHVQRERALRRETAAQQLEGLGKELDEKNEETRVLGQRYGAQPDRVRGALPYFIETLTEFQKAVRSYKGLGERLDEVRTRYQNQIQEFNQSLSRFDIQESTTPREASAALSTLQVQLREHSAAQADIRRFKEQIAHASSNLNEAEEGMQQTLDALRITAADAAQLPTFETAHAEYQALLRSKETQLQKAESLSKELNLEDETLLALSEEAIEQERGSLLDQQRLKDELLQTTATVSGDISRTKQERSLEKAIYESEQTEAKLQQLFEKQTNDALNSFLLDSVEQQYRQQSLPEVLHVACDLFTLFTQGSYQLLPSDATPNSPLGFRAKDTQSGEVLPLRALSRGTRTQLLLAARLAFAKRHEGKTRLPIVMDEVLSTSDPQRFAAIAESMLRLSVEEDRQILYFSSQPEDLARWQDVSRSLGIGNVSFEELDIGIKRYEVQPPDLLSARTVAEPLANENYHDYLERLGTPEIRANSDIGAIHIGHLLESAPRLHELLCLGLERFAQILVLRAHNSPLLSEEEFARMQAKADVLASTAKAAGLGRGRPLTPEVILQQNLSESFTDPMIALLERVDYDASKFISALKDKAIPKFRQDTISKFESRFVKEGFMSVEEPLTEDDARTRVIAEVSPHLQNKRLSAESFNAIFSDLWQRLGSSHRPGSQ